jgi:hypothetical protein
VTRSQKQFYVKKAVETQYADENQNLRLEGFAWAYSMSWNMEKRHIVTTSG